MTSLSESVLDGKISYPETWYGVCYDKFSQSNSRFNALDTLVVTVHSVKMPVGFGKRAIKSRGRVLSVMSRLKKSIVEMKSEENCLAHALIIAISRLENDPKYNSYRRRCRIRPVVQNVCETTGIDLSNGAGIPELVRFQEHFRGYKKVVYRCLRREDMMFEGQFDSPKRIILLFDVERHYHVIINLTGGMDRKYVCKACNKACRRDVKHVCDQTYSDCMGSTLCAFSHVRYPWAQCNRHFSRRKCFANHKQSTAAKKYVNESGVARRVDGSWHTKNTSVTSGSVTTVSRTKK